MTAGQTTGALRPARVPGAYVFGIALLVYGSTAGGSLTTTDAVVSYELTRSIIHSRTVALPRNLLGIEAHIGRDGRSYSPFGLGHSLYNIPFYLAGLMAQRITGLHMGKPDSITKATVAMGSVVAAAAAVWITFLFAWRLWGDGRTAAAVAFLLAFGTLLWPYAKFGFSAALVTACLAGSVYHAWTGVRAGQDRRLIASGACLGWALLVRHELALAVFPLAAWVALETGRRSGVLLQRLCFLLVPISAAIAVWLAYNFVRFGNPLDPGILREDVMHYGSIVMGLHGYLFAPGDSIFVYCPLALAGIFGLLPLWRRDRATAGLFIVLWLTFLPFYAGFSNWRGGRSYGPRYLVPLLPYLCLPLGGLLQRRNGIPVRLAILVLCAASVAVQIPGVLVDYSKVGLEQMQQAGGRVPDRTYSWEGSPLGANAAASVRAVPRNVRYVLNLVPPPGVERSADATRRDFAQQFSFSLDFWWLYLYYLGIIPAPVSLAVGLCPLALAAALAVRLFVRVLPASGGRTFSSLPG